MARAYLVATSQFKDNLTGYINQEAQAEEDLEYLHLEQLNNRQEQDKQAYEDYDY